MSISGRILRVTIWALPAAWWLAATAADAQNSSIFAVQQHAPLTMADSSWTYQKVEEPRLLKLHDLITVVVSEKSSVTSNGQIDRKKKGYGDLILPDWIKFWHGGLGAQDFPNGAPHVRGEIDNKLDTQGQLQTADAVTFHIACEVVDIRPNGNLILEGHRTIKNNEEVWDYSLTGEIRVEDVKPNNTVQSESVASLRINKREEGHVRDSYRRGWLLEWLDRWQPF
jgi:flagellar L-ring protein precursor FlgH